MRYEVVPGGDHHGDPCAGEEGVRHHPQEQGACAGWPTCKKHEGMLYFFMHIVLLYAYCILTIYPNRHVNFDLTQSYKVFLPIICYNFMI